MIKNVEYWKIVKSNLSGLSYIVREDQLRNEPAVAIILPEERSRVDPFYCARLIVAAPDTNRSIRHALILLEGAEESNDPSIDYKKLIATAKDILINALQMSEGPFLEIGK